MKAIIQFAGIAIVLAATVPAMFTNPGSGPVTLHRAPAATDDPDLPTRAPTGAAAALRADSDFGGHVAEYESRARAAAARRVAAERPAPVAAPAAPARKATVAAATQEAERTPKVRGGRARIPADARGHFITEAKLNGRRVEVMVDTGATNVAINRSLARRLGLRVNDSDFKHTANTANGKARMALGKLKSVRIGTVMVRDVEVAILEDKGLEDVLLGMSFLNKLRSFGVERGELVLVR